MGKRKGISTRTRFEIFKRDGFRCVHCGATPQGAPLHVDHIVAVSKGGTDEHSNLVTSCESCNLGKSNVDLGDHRFKVGDPERAKEHAAQLRAYLEAQQEVVGAIDGARQQLIDRWCETLGCDTFHKNLPSALTKAVEEFGIAAVVDIIDSVAASRHRWSSSKMAFETDIKYFYGCLRRLRETDGKPKAVPDDKDLDADAEALVERICSHERWLSFIAYWYHRVGSPAPGETFTVEFFHDKRTSPEVFAAIDERHERSKQGKPMSLDEFISLAWPGLPPKTGG